MELKVEKIEKSYGTRSLLQNISFSLAKGEKIGLVGGNGSGKSTLLKILAGTIQPDHGIVTLRKNAVLRVMEQDTSLVSEETIRDYLRRVSGIEKLEKELEYSLEAVTEFEHRSGYSFDHRLDAILAGLGLEKITSEQKITELSSGQKSKVFMAGILLSGPDILLLDEPTNNLDLPALLWLEDFMMRSNAVFIIVSHDRFFLDRTVQKIFEIDWQTHTLNITHGCYSDYLLRKEKDRSLQLAEYEAQQEKIQHLTEQARAKKNQAAQGARFVGSDNDRMLRGFKRDRAGRSGKVAKAIETRIAQMETIEKPIMPELFRIHLHPIKPGGSQEMILEEVVAGYAGHSFNIGPISLRIPYGSRMVILGLNGTGKSTLLQTISGELQPLSGKISIGSALVLGNLMQEHNNLPRNEKLKDFLMKRAGISIQEAYALIAKFGFEAEAIEQTIAALSPGGRARLLLALFSALCVNVLFLDEPTNHLDLEAQEALEEAVEHYKGTIILVSHDRYFLKKFQATETYLLANGKLQQQSLKTFFTDAKQQAKRLMRLL